MNKAVSVQLDIPQQGIRSFDTLTLQVHDEGKVHVQARAYLQDCAHHTYVGDWRTTTSQWQGVTVDIASVDSSGVDLDAITAVGLELRPQAGEDEVHVFTDTWELTSTYKAYIGQRLGISKTFYVQRDGTRLSVGQVGKFECTFYQRANEAGPVVRPWFEIKQGERMVLGQAGSGLALVDQEQLDRLGTRLIKDDGQPDGTAKNTPDPGLLVPFAGGESSFEWTVAWTSDVAALVEVKETCGPLDRLGRPAMVANWKFMIYQTGQMFVSVSWEPQDKTPAALVLMLDQQAMPDAQKPAAFLREWYPAEMPQKMLPHEMQSGAPVAMLAKTAAARESWFEAKTEKQHIFGVWLGRKVRQPVICTMLINAPTTVDQAAAFGSYLSPPTITMKVGTLDTTFPGDLDNDSLVETYGFQTIRMTDRRAWFTVEPAGRAIFYPTLLLTIPATEREQLDLSKFNLLINIDGHQMANPPRWPDGSFLVQLPFMVSKPVKIEATLVAK